MPENNMQVSIHTHTHTHTHTHKHTPACVKQKAECLDTKTKR